MAIEGLFSTLNENYMQNQVFVNFSRILNIFFKKMVGFIQVSFNVWIFFLNNYSLKE